MKRVPAEWHSHKVMWAALPCIPHEWGDAYVGARVQIIAMAKALAAGEKVRMLVMGDASVQQARAEIGDANIEIIAANYGDIWVRDTAPIFTHDDDGAAVALTFKFNGWGGKYVMPHDDEVADFVAAKSGAKNKPYDFVLEGGSVDFDGEGRVLTTKECLLNANRNPALSQTDIEARLREAFGVTQIIWLTQGLMNDHTDGHIDNIARFVAPNRAVCHSPSGNNDPNAATYEAIARDLRQAGVEVVQIPSPGLITNADGDVMPASHMNFIIGNEVVVMPKYEDVYAPAAVAALAPLFPTRKIIALPADQILAGGGSFHCCTQQEPTA